MYRAQSPGRQLLFIVIHKSGIPSITSRDEKIAKELTLLEQLPLVKYLYKTTSMK